MKTTPTENTSKTDHPKTADVPLEKAPPVNGTFSPALKALETEENRIREEKTMREKARQQEARQQARFGFD